MVVFFQLQILLLKIQLVLFFVQFLEICTEFTNILDFYEVFHYIFHQEDKGILFSQYLPEIYSMGSVSFLLSSL